MGLSGPPPRKSGSSCSVRWVLPGHQDLHHELPSTGDGDAPGPNPRQQGCKRITIPLAALKQFPDVYQKLVGQIPQSSMVEVKVNWRCNVLDSWVAEAALREDWLRPRHPGDGLHPTLRCAWPCAGSCTCQGTIVQSVWQPTWTCSADGHHEDGATATSTNRPSLAPHYPRLSPEEGRSS